MEVLEKFNFSEPFEGLIFFFVRTSKISFCIFGQDVVAVFFLYDHIKGFIKV